MNTIEIPEDVAETLTTARRVEQDAEDLALKAAAMVREAVTRLQTQHGWKQGQIAEAMGVSKQRVSQIINPPAKKSRRKDPDQLREAAAELRRRRWDDEKIAEALGVAPRRVPQLLKEST